MDKHDIEIINKFIEECEGYGKIEALPRNNLALLSLCRDVEILLDKLNFKVYVLTYLQKENRSVFEKLKNTVMWRHIHLCNLMTCFNKKVVNDIAFDAFRNFLAKTNRDMIALNEIVDSEYGFKSALRAYMNDNEDAYKGSIGSMNDASSHDLASQITKEYGNKTNPVSGVVDDNDLTGMLTRYAVAIQFSYTSGLSFYGIDKIDTNKLKSKLGSTGKKGICIATRTNGRSRGRLLYVSGKYGELKSDMTDAVTLDSLEDLGDAFDNEKNLLLEFISLIDNEVS